jgi:two-component system NtrC family response regulator
MNHLPPPPVCVDAQQVMALVPDDLDGRLAELEKQFMLSALQQSQGVQAAAAQLLGISERSFWYRLKKLGIQVDRIAR